VRVFLALPLPAGAARPLSAALSRLRAAGPGVKPVSPEALHITLHFFGELSEDAVDEVSRALEDPRLAGPPIRASLGGLGTFPSSGTPQVVFRRLDTGTAEVRSYRELTLGVLAPLGYRPDGRPFEAHLTLARNRGGKVDLGEAMEAPVPDFSFEECTLFRSILDRDGAHYSVLKRIPFREVDP